MSDKERELFEAWFSASGEYEPEWLEGRQTKAGFLYSDADTENMWEAWQARAALSTPQADKVPAAEGASREPSDADYRRWAGSSGAHLREDYDQSTPYAIFHNATQWMNFCETVRSVHRELATPPAKMPQEAKPVYQAMHAPGMWEDVAKEIYDERHGFYRRIVYAAPQPATTGGKEKS